MSNFINDPINLVSISTLIVGVLLLAYFLYKASRFFEPIALIILFIFGMALIMWTQQKVINVLRVYNLKVTHIVYDGYRIA